MTEANTRGKPWPASPRRARCAIGALVCACGLALPAARAQDEEVAVEQPTEDQLVEFFPMSEPVELMEIVNFIVDELGINVSVKGTVTGTVMFSAKQEVPRSRLLELMESLLSQYNYSLMLDPVGFYVIQPTTDAPPTYFDGDFATTKIISTPNIKPSALKAVLEPGVQPGGQGQRPISYVDDLGIIVVTDTPRKVRSIEKLVEQVLGEYRRTTFTRIELRHVAAQAARERAVSLVGQSGTLRGGVPGQEQVAQIAGQASSLDNLADRLTIDPTGNALMFRGTEEEIAQVRTVLDLIDLPTTLTPMEYTAGAGAAMIANIASQRGLGQVILLEDVLTGSQQQQQTFPFNFPRGGQQFQGQDQTQSTLGGGSVMMVDQARGKILYYGTEEQQQQLGALIDALEIELEEIVIERYAVRNVSAEDLATLLQSIIENESASDTALLPGARGTQTGGAQGGLREQLLRAQQEAAGGQAAEGSFVATAEDSFVTFHEETNVVVVKAPLKLQQQFARIIEQLDVRRPQVYVDVKILAVSNTRDFTLAVEGQLKAGQFFTQTAFGLGTRAGGAEGAAFTDPKLPLPGLGGYTAALIKSSYVPFILNAIQTDTDARIVSSPQLLANDNTEAAINSIEEQPFTTTQSGQTTDQTTFGGYETAGTTLTITPSISEAGYLRLAYEIELSNFTGSGQDGIPPPKNTRNVSSESVTIPSDTTIVVGGITVDDTRNTVVKVPLLGDIPIVGLLFRDTNKINTEQVLYIFITPRILNDRNFADLRLLTKGPQEFAQIESDIPDLEPTTINLLSTPWAMAPDEEAPLEGFPGDEDPAIIPLIEDNAGVVRRTEDR